MKIKKIVLAMISTLILLAITFCQSVYASKIDDITLPAKFVRLIDETYNSSELEYAIGNASNVNGTNGLSINRIGLKKDGAVTRIYDAYCAWANRGFNLRNDIDTTPNSGEDENTDTYKNKYDMNDTENKETIISKNILRNFTINGKSSYDAILQLADLFYTEEDDFDSYKETTLQYVIDSNVYGIYCQEDYDYYVDNRKLLKEDEVRCIQQLAVWYFTNYSDSLYSNSDKNFSNFISESMILLEDWSFRSKSTGNFQQLSSEKRDQAKCLLKYYIETALANVGQPTASDVYIYTNEDTNATSIANTQTVIIIEKQNRIFDLALRKFITKINDKDVKISREPDTSEEVDVDTFESGERTAKKVHTKDPLTVKKGDKVLYTIRIYNEGEVNGFAKEVTDYLPAGLDLVAYTEGDGSINDIYGWKKDSTGKIIKTEKLKNVEIKAANRDWSKLDDKDDDNKDVEESELCYRDLQVECIVNQNATNENLKNIAEITKSQGKNGENDIDSTTGNVHTTGYSPTHYNDNTKISTGRGEEDDDDFENLKLEEVIIHKGVKTVENQDSGYDKDEKQKWVINSTIPVGIEYDSKYVIKDDIDYRLVFSQSDAVSVRIINSNKQLVKELTNGSDYKFLYEPGLSYGIQNTNSSGRFSITFIADDISNEIKQHPGDIVEVAFYTNFAVDTNGKLLAELGTNIPNTSRLEYGNGNTIDSETPEVHTGGVSLYKYKKVNGQKVALPGAKFQIFDNKAAADTWFDDNENNNATGIAEKTSDGNGLVTFTGLKYGGDAKDKSSNFNSNDGTYVQGRNNDGTPKNYSQRAKGVGTQYWIVETEVPEGYRSTLTGPISVIIDEDSHNITIATAEDVDLEEDDNSGRAVENKPKEFDLALRKFLVKVNGELIENRVISEDKDNSEQNRTPVITGESLTGNKLNDGEQTAEKKHPKTPVTVRKGDRVVYTIRVYNEGEIDGYAKKITDYLPEGLTFLEAGDVNDATHSTINRDYGWSKDTADTKGNAIATRILQNDKITAVQRNWSKLDDKENEEPIYYRDLLIECVVNSDATNSNLMNIAEITDSEGEGGFTDSDSDTGNVETNTDEYNPSHPENGRGEEDDDDFEDLRLYFDLALRKYITKVERDGEEIEIASRVPDVDEWNLTKDGKDFNKDGYVNYLDVQLLQRYINNWDLGLTEEEKQNLDVDGNGEVNMRDLATLQRYVSWLTTATYKHKKDPVAVQNGDYVYYTITVYNEGDVNGHAKEITDQLPSYVIPQVNDSDFITSTKFKLAENGYDATKNTLKFVRKVADNNPQKAYEKGKLVDYSESITVKCKLNYTEEDDNTKIFTNIAWISNYYCEGLGETDDDIDSEASTHPEKTKDQLVTPGIGYTGKENYTEEQLKDSEKYYEGQQDDDDFEKIKITNGPEIHKGVKTVENQDSGYDKDEEHTWVINSTIPVDIGDQTTAYKKYDIKDDIDYRLLYQSVESVKILSADANGHKDLVEGTDYIFTYTPNEDEDAISTLLNKPYTGSLKFTFIDNQTENFSNIIKQYGGKVIEIKFKTKFVIKDGKILAELGTNIPNTSKLEYSNVAVPNGEKHSETPEVHTGGISLFKYTNANGEIVGLKGAEFKIFDSQAKAKTWTDDDETNNATAIATATSDTNGLITFTGIKYGEDAEFEKDGTTVRSENYISEDGIYVQDKENVNNPEAREIPGTDYWIVETKAPSKYKEDKTVRKVTIDKESHKIQIATAEEKQAVIRAGKGIENIPEEIDLALRKFITRVGPELPITDDNSTPYTSDISRGRAPEPTNLEALYNGEVKTATYNHTKQPVEVNVGDYVEYTLRVFNEGSMDAYAKEITDHLPKYLEYVDCEQNSAYGWVVSKDGRTVKTDYLKDTILYALKKNVNNQGNSISDITNNAKQKTDIGAASDYIYIAVTEALTQYYDDVYVSQIENSNTAGRHVIETIKPKFDENPKVGDATISINNDGTIIISTKDFAKKGQINETNGALTWGNIIERNSNSIDMDSTEKLKALELKIICKVKDDVPYEENQTNIAEITKYGDKNNEDLDRDRDSQTPDGGGEVKLPSDEELPDYKKTEIERNDDYIPGQQDDDDFEKVYVKNFDLALRKFITKVEAGTEHNKGQDRYTQADYEARVPKISQESYEKLCKGEVTTLDYSHSKEPMMTALNDKVTYTLRIYNEGQVDGYAEVITDDIPDGVEFIPGTENETNKEYGWRMYKEIKTRSEANGAKVVECKVKEDEEVRLFVETENAKEATIIRTDYLSMKNGKEKNLIKAFNPNAELSNTNPDYRDIKVVFKVTEPYGSKRIITNYAQISEDKDKNGKEVKDRDSETDIWKKGDDDQDVEHIRVPDFDLALRKWVTQSIVIENGETVVQETGHDAWDDPEEPAKVELHRRKLSNVTVKFRFSIRVYNQSEIDGYVKEIKDHIPQGLKFLPEDNPEWVDEGNNVITTKQLENTLLKPGQYTDVEVLLTWINGADNLGLKTNYAEISKDFNDWGAPDNDSTPDNMWERHEDDDDEAPVILSVSTGVEESYIILTLSVLTALAVGIALIKKYVM